MLVHAEQDEDAPSGDLSKQSRANKGKPYRPDEAVHRHSAEGRALYGGRFVTLGPVFGSVRHHKELNRFTLRGKVKVNAQWKLFCLMHDIEKLAHYGTCNSNTRSSVVACANGTVKLPRSKIPGEVKKSMLAKLLRRFAGNLDVPFSGGKGFFLQPQR